jgi:hypothetical protein
MNGRRIRMAAAMLVVGLVLAAYSLTKESAWGLGTILALALLTGGAVLVVDVAEDSRR